MLYELNYMRTDQIHSPELAGQPRNPANGQAVPSNADRIAAITEYLNCDLQPDTKGNLPSTTELEPFRPNILHAAHKPFPIALVNRRPHGRPGHGDTVNPQDAAWLAGFRFAKKSVFIQTPTFNAPPVVEACLEAVRRGIVCTLYLDLGFNDEGELLPYQGGTNEDVSEKMYHELEEDQRHLLQVYWYTGKDMDRPINAKEQKRNCHVKLMIVDECVGIQGNGNQDSQSWFHSQEIKSVSCSRRCVHCACADARRSCSAMIDSPQICQEWVSQRPGSAVMAAELCAGCWNTCCAEYSFVWRVGFRRQMEGQGRQPVTWRTRREYWSIQESKGRNWCH